MRVLIIGGGGREHAIAWKLQQEGHEIHAAPGNPGIAQFGHCVALDVKDHRAVAQYIRGNDIGFTVVGPEAPLAAGIVDHFEQEGLPIFGPRANAALIETSKNFCCQLLEQAHVPIPHTTYHENIADMHDAAKGMGGIVLKKSGLAAGKGAEVIRTAKELPEALARLTKLGDGECQIQNLASGPELSFFVLTDGVDFIFLGSAQDYKPLYPGGPNTGGMGGFSPHPLLTPELRRTIEETIVRPTIAALAAAGRAYRGVMYFQLMITEYGPVVIEINCRFGDPEAQLLMPLLNCDLLPLLQATAQTGKLKQLQAHFLPQVAVGVVMASEGYPDSPITGREIVGLDPEFVGPNDPAHYAYVFHAGTKLVDGRLTTSGGRVLTVVGIETTYGEAKKYALTAVNLIKFEGEYHRTDIADEVINS